MFMNFDGNHSFPSPQVNTQQTIEKKSFNEIVNRYNQQTTNDLPSDTARHACRVCGKTFRASSLLDIHMRVHVGAKPFVCPVCNHRATQKGNLKLHMKKHHGLDLPTHIDMIPDSGIWGNTEISMEKPQFTGDNYFQSGRRKTALAHSSLLDPEIVELIKKCQNNIGQSNMGRITENLRDFVEMAKRNGITQDKIKNFENTCKAWDNANANNNGKEDGLKKNNTGFSFPPHLLNGIKEKCDQVENAQRRAMMEAKMCVCSVCGWRTTSAGYLNVHMRKHKVESHVCTICGRAFKETWYLKNHMRSHINELSYQPLMDKPIHNKPTSDVQIFSSSRLGMATQEHKESILSYCMCQYCGQMFHVDKLSSHARSCSFPHKNPIKSASEKEQFMLSLDLVPSCCKKEEMVPKPEQKFNPTIGCINVATKSLETNDLEENLNPGNVQRTAIGGVENLIPNHQNGFQNSIQSLEAHNESFISAQKLKPYRNPAMQSLASIGKSLTDKNYFQTQVVQSHEMNSINDMSNTQQNGYKCNFCPKWFKYRSVLGIHMRSHTGERPYKCQYCGYAGTQHNCLKLHLQRHHPKEYNAMQDPGLKPSQQHISYARSQDDIKQENEILVGASKFSPARCPICGRVSPSPGYLKIHMRSHKKTLDHVCNICGRGFKEYWYLSTHLRTHDREGFNAAPVESNCNKITYQPTKQQNQPIQHHQQQQQQPRMDNEINPAVQMLIKNHIKRPKLELQDSQSSWCPLDLHEDIPASFPSSSQHLTIQEPKPAHVSRRKSSQPSRHTVERYVEEAPVPPVRSRKSRPRKLSRTSYMAPVFQTLSTENEENEDNNEFKTMQMNFDTQQTERSDDQPLDLSVAAPFSRNQLQVSESGNTEIDEPLNLVIKE